MDTQGGDVTVDATTITLAGGTISTRAYNVAAPGTSTADSGAVALSGVTLLLGPNSAILADVGGDGKHLPGDVTLTASVVDRTGALPVDVIPGSDPSITLERGSAIKGGLVDLEATKVNQTQSPLLPITILSVQTKNVAIAVTGAVIEGTDVTVAATAEDKDLLSDGSGGDLVNNFLTPVGGQDPLGLVLLVPLALQAVSVVIRKATAAVTLTDAIVRGSGNVSIASSTTVSSAASPQGGIDPAKGKYFKAGTAAAGGFAPVAAGYAKADGSAVTLITGTSSITADGDVTIASGADTTATVSALVMTNSVPGSKTTNKQTGKVNDSTRINNAMESNGASFAFTDSRTVSNATVDPAVTIESKGTVTVNATGNVDNEAAASSFVYIDGAGSFGIAVGLDQADVKSSVLGKIKAARCASATAETA